MKVPAMSRVVIGLLTVGMGGVCGPQQRTDGSRGSESSDRRRHLSVHDSARRLRAQRQLRRDREPK
jgi:hypothetical protein